MEALNFSLPDRLERDSDAVSSLQYLHRQPSGSPEPEREKQQTPEPAQPPPDIAESREAEEATNAGQWLPSPSADAATLYYPSRSETGLRANG